MRCRPNGNSCAGRREWNGDGELGPFSLSADQADVPSIGVAELLDDGQSQAASTCCSAARCFKSVKGLENRFPLSRRNSGALVGNADSEVIFVSPVGQGDRPGASIIHRVLQQVSHHAFESLCLDWCAAVPGETLVDVVGWREFSLMMSLSKSHTSVSTGFSLPRPLASSKV